MLALFLVCAERADRIVSWVALSVDEMGGCQRVSNKDYKSVLPDIFGSTLLAENLYMLFLP